MCHSNRRCGEKMKETKRMNTKKKKEKKTKDETKKKSPHTDTLCMIQGGYLGV